MIIGILTLELYMAASSSLKEKRTVLKSLKDRIRNNFNVSIAEIDHHDLWQRAVLAAVAVGVDKQHLDGALSKVVDFVNRDRLAELTNYSIELI